LLNADATRDVVLKQVIKIIKNDETKWAVAEMLENVTSQPEVKKFKE